MFNLSYCKYVYWFISRHHWISDIKWCHLKDKITCTPKCNNYTINCLFNPPELPSLRLLPTMRLPTYPFNFKCPHIVVSRRNLLKELYIFNYKSQWQPRCPWTGTHNSEHTNSIGMLRKSERIIDSSAKKLSSN